MASMLLRYKALTVGMFGVWFSIWLCSGALPGAFSVAVSAAEPGTSVRQAAGEIIWLDTQLGQLQLHTERPRGTWTTTQYSITQQDTRVTDHLDKQFLAITDLRAGQLVKIESKGRGQEQLATKITVEPTSAPLFEEAEGTIQAIEASNPGTFTLKESLGTQTAGTVSVFVFDPNAIVVMESPSLQPIRLEVKPGDFVKVAYVVNDGQRHARSMMRYSVIPAPASTTTTTTISTTTTREVGVN